MSCALLVVGAHPDDEVLLAGGVLARAAADGRPTAVLSMTRGELGPIADPALLAGRTLADTRVAELRAAAAELGVTHVRCWRRSDGMLRWTPAAVLARQLARLIDELEPEAVVSFGEDGLYGHPDHIAVGRITRRAVLESRVRPALLEAAWPMAVTAAIDRELAELGLQGSWWGLEPDAIGVDEAELDGAVAHDVADFAIRRLRALRAHRTQLDPGHALSLLPESAAPRLLGREWLRARG